MKVWIAGMKFRGRWATAPEGSIRVNVTSAQSKQSKDRLAFSPMHVHDRRFVKNGESFANFEGFWQSRKVLNGLDHGVSKRFWTTAQTARRRHPEMKKRGVSHCEDERRPGEKLNYVESRKSIYIPDYHHAFLEGSQRVRELRDSGRDVVVFDLDGPKDADGEPLCLPATVEILREKIADTSAPFGHGYVVAAALAGIPLSEFA